MDWYCKSQLDQLQNTDFYKSIKIYDSAGNSTKILSLNSESIPVFITFLKKELKRAQVLSKSTDKHSMKGGYDMNTIHVKSMRFINGIWVLVLHNDQVVLGRASLAESLERVTEYVHPQPDLAVNTVVEPLDDALKAS